MMLPAKSCNPTKSSLYSVSIAVCILSAIAVFSSGCKPKEEPVDPQKSLYGDVVRPSWTAQENYDYTSSMTAVISMDSLVTSSEDVLAAFIGDECRGIATYDSGLFYLYIAGPGESVMLRYWSAHYKNLFAAEPIPFVNDTQLGATAEPYKPNWVVAKE